MPIFTEKQKGAFWGFTLGLAAVAVGRKVFPNLKNSGRPITKAAIKGSMAAYTKARRLAAQLGENIEDIVAEAIQEKNADDLRREEEFEPQSSEVEAETVGQGVRGGR
jgi:Protein of unknown function (DUF5132)